MVTKKNNTYNANSLKELSSRQHLLKRMSLTFGDPETIGEFSSQKNVAIRELTDNAVDECLAGYGTKVKVNFFEDRSFEVIDNGRGIPVDVGKRADGSPASGIFLALGVIQSGGKFETDSDRFSSGLNGVGASSTVAVSSRADVKVWKNGKQYELSFKDGVPGFFDGNTGPDDKFREAKDATELKIVKDPRPAKEKKENPTGTSVKVWLDDKVFSSHNPYSDQDIIERLKGTAFLTPTMKVEVYNELNPVEDKFGNLVPQTESFFFPRGVEESIELIQPDEPIIEPIHIITEGSYIEKNVPVLQPDGKIVNQDVNRRVPIDVIFTYGINYDRTVESFVNTIRTKSGGVHEQAFVRAMMATFSEKFTSMRGFLSKKDEKPTEDDYYEGMTAILSVQISEPTFKGQSKEELSGREVAKAIQTALSREFEKWIADKKNQDALKIIAKKVVAASRNRQRARESRELNRKRNEIKSAVLPDTLWDCVKAGTPEAELYICEGSSAVTALKSARDGQLNALLGIKGKIINAHKATLKSVLSNDEVENIIKSLDAGFGPDFNIEKMRYGKVFIATDADADGNAIACLLYALFWHLFRPVITENRLYKIETPLFVISTKEGAKSRKIYAKDDAERDREVSKLEKKNIRYSVTRLKGLGEVSEDDLEKTAINPETRVVTRIETHDMDAVFKTLEVIFGKDTEIRKQWIQDCKVDEELLEE